MKKLILTASALMLCSTFIAGCGEKEEEKTADGYAKEIYLYNWSEYMSQEVLDGFEEEYGIKVIETTFESNDEMLAKLLAGNNGEYDIAVPSNFYIDAMVENNLIQPLNYDNIPNIENIDPDYRSMSYDPEGKYTIPYMGTVCTWVANTSRLAEKGLKADTFEDLKNPALAGDILISDDAQGNICQALAASGKDPTSTSFEDIQLAKEWLLDMNEQIKAYSLPADVRDSMIKGETTIAYMYSGNIMQAMEENSDIQLALEEEQASLSVDTFVILEGSKHVKEAELFLNYLLRPEVSAKLIEAFPYVCFNQAAVEYLSENLANSPMIVLSEDLKNRLYMLNSFDGEGIGYMIDAMTEVKSAR